MFEIFMCVCWCEKNINFRMWNVPNDYKLQFFFGSSINISKTFYAVYGVFNVKNPHLKFNGVVSCKNGY